MKLDTMTQRLNTLTKQNYSQQEVLRWIDICSGTQPNPKDPAFLKIRAHIFQRNTREYGLVLIKSADKSMALRWKRAGPLVMCM